MKNINIEKLINWGELSRLLSGTRSVVTRLRAPKKHEPKIELLKSKINEWWQQINET